MTRRRGGRRGSTTRSGRITWLRASEARAKKSVRASGDRAGGGVERGRRRRGQRTRSQPERDRTRGRQAQRPEIVRGAAFTLSLLAGALLAGPVVGALQAWWAHESIELSAISVQGNRRLTPASVAAATGVAKGSAFEAVSGEEVESALLAHPWIRSAEALPLPTGRLLVRIGEREPRAALYWEDAPEKSARWRVVDASGVPFAPAEPRDIASLPHLRAARSAAQQGPANRQLARGVALLESLSQLAAGGGEASAAALSGAELSLPDPESSRGWVLRMGEPQRQVILGESGLDQRLEQLALLLETGPEELEAAREIDLRFADRAVLRSSSTFR